MSALLRRFIEKAASSSLAATLTPSASSLTVADGSAFPASDFDVYVTDGGYEEIVHVATRSGNTFSGLSRGQLADPGNPTPAGHFKRGATVILGISADSVGESGGGSTPEQGVQVKFDTPNLYTQAFDITAVDLEAQTVTIAGDHTDLFPVGVWLNIVGSTGNDSPYLIADVAFAGGNTVVTVDPAAWSPLGNDTADGQLVNTGTAGITIYTPQAGDILYLMVNETGPIISTFEAFDQVVDAHFASLDYQNGDLAVIVQPFEQDNWTGFHVTQTTDQYAISLYPWQALRFADTTPFKMFVTANASLLPPDPLPSMGRSVVVPNVIRGPEYPA